MADDRLTLKYNSGDTREHNIFTEEYFSGADVAIYVNGEKLTHISGLSYQIQEQLKPIFGYASRTFDDVAIGNRIVVGMLRVPIHNPEENSTREIEVIVDSVDEEVAEEAKKNNYPGWVENALSHLQPLSGSTWKASSNPSSAEESRLNSLQSLEGKEFSDELRKTQTQLLKLGYAVEINGFYDTKTKGVVRQIQSDYNLNQSGVLDTETLAVIQGLNTGSFANLFVAPDTAIRTGPGMTYPTITTLEQSTNVRILRTVSDWFYVQLSNGTKGYISKTGEPDVYIPKA